MAGVALSSLRVSAEIDAAPYARGAGQKVAADQAMIASDKARNASLAQADAAMKTAIPGLTSISRSLLDGYGAGATFEAQIRKIGNAIDRGMGLDRAQVLLDAAYRKFGMTADAVALAERGFVSIVPAVQAANRAFETNIEIQARSAAQAERSATAQRSQAGINAQFGIGSAPATELGASFSALAAREEQAAASAQKLRAQIDPMGSEFAALGKQMAIYKGYLNDGLISSHEYEQAQVLLAKRLTDVQMQLKNTGTTGRVAAGELVNLSYQLNDVVTGLALGQSPFMILAQQGGQVFQIFQSSKGSVFDFFSAIGSKAMGFLTLGRVVFGGVTAAIGASIVALNSYLAAQQKVNLSLLGSGRASGATNASINSIAQQGSSLTGLSVSEAREFASALAQTGRIANDNILPIVKMGKDISHVFGIDASEAAKMLADAFSDPSKGADQLNQRLGFLDAGLKRNIDNLVAQNRVFDAQQALLQGVKSGLSGIDDVVSRSSKFWTVLGNAISNAWGGFGEFIARGIGGFENLEQQIARTRGELQQLQSYQSSTIVSGGDLGYAGDAGASAEMIQKKREELERLEAVQQRLANSSATAAAAQRSFLQATTAQSLLPEIAEQDKLNNSLRVLKDLFTSLGNDEGAGARLAQIGLTMKQIAEATAVATEKVKSFKTDFDAAVSAGNTALQAVTAFSPKAKGDVAYQQSIDANRKSNLDGAQKQVLAEQAYTLAVKQATTAISEAQRARELSANQAIASSQLEVQLLGKTIGQQTELRANLAARQQLEQEASVNRTGFDNARFESLKKINALLGEQAQISARAAVNDNIRFGRQTSMLSQEDVQIATQLKGLYPDVATALDSVEAAGLRTNNALSTISNSLSGTLVTGLTDIADGTKSIAGGAGDMARSFVRALNEMIIKLFIIAPLMRAMQGMFGGFGSLFGGGAGIGPMPDGSVVPSAKGNVFAGGNVIPFATGGIISRPTMFQMANGRTGLAGEAGTEAIVPLRRGPDGRLGVSAMGSGGQTGGTSISFGDIHISVPEGTDTRDAGALGREVKSQFIQVIDERLRYHNRGRGR